MIFCASSEAALVFHDNFDGDGSSATDLLIPTVASLRGLVARMGFSPADARKQFVRTGEGYTRTDDRMVPKRAAGEFFRRVKAELLAPVDTDTVLGEKATAALDLAFAELRKACESGNSKREYAQICSDVMHVHSIRLLTTWCEIPNLEAISYFVCEKVLAAEAALKARDAAK